jgi:lia operon protein LiaF
MRGTTLWGILFIVLGIVFLADKAGVLMFDPVLFSPGVLWPLVFVVLGFGGVKKLFRGRIAWWELFLVVLGVSLSLHNTGYVGWLNAIPSWDLVGALFLIFLGLSITLPSRLWRKKWRVEVNAKHSEGVHFELGTDDVIDGIQSWKEAKKRNAVRRFIGDVTIGRQPWRLKDLDIWNAIGDVRVNLGTAHAEEGTYRVTIGGWVGDVRVLVPSSLPVLIQSDIRIGNIDVFGEKNSGTSHHVVHEDPGFQTASTRVVIEIDLKIGDVQVVRV